MYFRKTLLLIGMIFLVITFIIVAQVVSAESSKESYCLPPLKFEKSHNCILKYTNSMEVGAFICEGDEIEYKVKGDCEGGVISYEEKEQSIFDKYFIYFIVIINIILIIAIINLVRKMSRRE